METISFLQALFCRHVLGAQLQCRVIGREVEARRGTVAWAVWHRSVYILASDYGWITEGFDTLDLKEAKALLEVMS